MVGSERTDTIRLDAMVERADTDGLGSKRIPWLGASEQTTWLRGSARKYTKVWSCTCWCGSTRRRKYVSTRHATAADPARGDMCRPARGRSNRVQWGSHFESYLVSVQEKYWCTRSQTAWHGHTKSYIILFPVF